MACGLLGTLLYFRSRGVMEQTVIDENGVQVLFTYPKSFREFDFIECEKRILSLINDAKSSIYVQAYNWTSERIAEALVAAQKRGVQVKVLLDKENEVKTSRALQILLDSQITVRIRRISGIAHNKIMVIDEKIVITGSYNFTKAANEKNDENLVIINNTSIAKQYLTNWQKCRSISFPIGITADSQKKPWEEDYGRISEQQNEKAKSISNYIDSATKLVYIILDRQLPDDALASIVSAYMRGVDVRILIPNEEISPELSLFIAKLGQVPLKRSKLKLKNSSIILDGKIEMYVKDRVIVKTPPEPSIEEKIHKFQRRWDKSVMTYGNISNAVS